MFKRFNKCAGLCRLCIMKRYFYHTWLTYLYLIAHEMTYPHLLHWMLAQKVTYPHLFHWMMANQMTYPHLVHWTMAHWWRMKFAAPPSSSPSSLSDSTLLVASVWSVLKWLVDRRGHSPSAANEAQWSGKPALGLDRVQPPEMCPSSGRGPVCSGWGWRHAPDFRTARQLEFETWKR